MEEKQLCQEWKNVSLSHGTMIAADIVESVKNLIPEKMYNEFKHAEDDMDLQEEILNEDIWNYLNSIAPKDCYFGSHPGDGSDFGFWEVEED